MSSVVQLAAEIEYYVFAAAFLIAVCVLSVGAGLFLIRAALDHTFPNWRNLGRFLKDRPKPLRFRKVPKSSA